VPRGIILVVYLKGHQVKASFTEKESSVERSTEYMIRIIAAKDAGLDSPAPHCFDVYIWFLHHLTNARARVPIDRPRLLEAAACCLTLMETWHIR
jgi:hypothetical protein